MKTKIVSSLFIGVVFLSSCSSRYKTTQTPDDMYYSPVEFEETVTKTETKVNREDEFLKRKVMNRNRWTNIDDYSYWHDSRNFDCYNNWNTYNNHFNTWNNYNNCYQCCNNSFGFNNNWNNNYWNGYGWNNPRSCFVTYFYPKTVKEFSKTNVLAYSNPNYNNTNYSYGKFSNDQSNNIKDDKTVRTIRGNNNNGNNTYNPSRTFDSPNSSNTPSTPSSNAGGNSGGFNSKGTSTSKPRG